MNANFSKGDAVRLINGHSPVMTIMTAVPTVGGGVFTCCWFDATSNFRSQIFAAEMLKPIDGFARL